MSLYFDDFVPFCSSRAVEEDDDFVEDERTVELTSATVVRWSPKARKEILASGVICCNRLVVATGTPATGFVQVHLLASEPCEIIGAVCFGIGDHDVNTIGQESSTDQACFIYRLVNHHDVILVQCRVEVATEQLFSCTEQVLSKLCSSSTVVSVLTNSCITEYRSSLPPSDLPLNFLRHLKSSKYECQPVCPPLEQPNILAGLPAQVLTYCQLHGIPCILYVCYADNSCLRSETIKAFRDVVSCSSLKDVFASVHPNDDQALKKLYEAQIKHTTLYI